MELFVLKTMQSRSAMAVSILKRACQACHSQLETRKADRVSLVLGVDEQAHYTIRAYDESGALVMTIHAPNYQYFFQTRTRKRRSGTGAGFNPEAHVYSYLAIPDRCPLLYAVQFDCHPSNVRCTGKFYQVTPPWHRRYNTYLLTSGTTADFSFSTDDTRTAVFY
ncbi:hypothetical protein K435DRAFT_814315 [Dendrothele bispora CBS 962.96]|uniref:Uncharacterized protein n=1 Tax=Dendrothele bispora (strain CBS 962.96) TaxID=1314807 RepID=A0A4S8KJ93_DENBC|nr:hypothetical protein K435DRAFT_814315 [Dendrothele bispora CBS 962.96]